MSTTVSKPVVINIHPHGPPYGYAATGDEPDKRWDRPDALWIGAWRREWPVVLGEAVLQASRDLEWEVWQLDPRADQRYAVTWESGVTHRLFPAALRHDHFGGRAGLHSDLLLADLASDARPMILTLHGFRLPFHLAVIHALSGPRRPPILLLGHGGATAPISEFWAPHRPATYLSLWLEQFAWRRALRHVDVIAEQNDAAERQVRRVYEGRVERLSMGCDFDFWTPPDAAERAQARQALGIPEEAVVLLASGNFVPRKRLDLLLRACTLIRPKNPFVLLVAGHGEPGQTAELERLAMPLTAQGRARLLRFPTGEPLRTVYWAADAYLSVSTWEGSSVGVMKAMACGLPILSTPIDGTAELLARHGRGRLIPVDCERVLPSILDSLIDHGPPPALDRGIARAAYDWPQVARRFVDLYGELSRR